MSTFAPNTPQVNAPIDVFWPRAIQNLRPNETASYLAKGIGETGLGVVKAADFVNQNTIDNKVHAGMDDLVQGEMSLLDRVDESIQSGNPNKNPPGELNQGGPMDVLHEARANGRLTLTGFLMARDSLAKDLRSQYNNDPRYTDIIDAKISQYTHQDPANLAIRSRIQDLDSYLTAKNDKSNWLLHQAITSGMPNGDQMVASFKSGKITADELEGSLAKFYSAKGAYEEAKWKHDQLKIGDEDKERQATLAIRKYTSSITTQAMDNIVSSTGQKYQDIINSKKMTGSQWIEYDAQWQKYRIQQFNQAFAKFTKEFPEVDQGVIAKNITDGMAAIDAFHKHVRDDHGVATAVYDALKNENDTTTQGIWKRNPDLLALKDLPPAIGAILAPTVAKRLGDPTQYGRAFGLKVKTATDVDENNSLMENQDAIDKGGASEKEKRELTRDNIENVNSIPAFLKAGDSEHALIVANAVFRDDTHSIISRLPAEKGPNDQGRTWAWRTFTSPSVRDAMWELKEQGHGDAWDKYTDFVTKGGQLMMQQDINDINKLHDVQMKEAGSLGRSHMVPVETNPQLHGTTVSWNSDTMKWKFDTNLPESNPYVPYYRAAVDRINKSLDAFKGVAEREGLDVQEYVLRNLLLMHADTQHGFSVPAQLLQSLLSANQTQEPEPTEKK